MTHHTTLLAHDDIGEPGRCVVLLPGAGDVRSEHRFLGAALAAAGYRVVAVDLPGHGDSPIFDSYGVEETAGSLLDLLDHLDAGPVSVVACSFSPAAAVWAATDRPGAIERMVMISPHLETAEGLRDRILRASVSALLRGPWAGSMWTKQVRSGYPSGTPADLDVELEKLRIMFSDPARRRAARDTLTAHRRGLQPRIARLDTPAMVVFGSADSHFSDPGAEAEAISAATNATITMIEGAGHYPHAERPDETAAAVLDFLGR
jgi:pimeloyl-ACP methyl ester carboxylesterase